MTSPLRRLDKEWSTHPFFFYHCPLCTHTKQLDRRFSNPLGLPWQCTNCSGRPICNILRILFIKPIHPENPFHWDTPWCICEECTPPKLKKSVDNNPKGEKALDEFADKIPRIKVPKERGREIVDIFKVKCQDCPYVLFVVHDEANEDGVVLGCPRCGDYGENGWVVLKGEAVVVVDGEEVEGEEEHGMETGGCF